MDKFIRLFEFGSRSTKREGTGFGYSCMTSIDENTVGILYESSQANLVFQRLKIADLFQGQ